ncbi:MAG: ribosomal-protein-alanine N-acetyltransferase [Clostridiales bacterium]|nr:ribosomal-protein-alanine N-acetyltransferase [Clostridiales bacterium]
MKTEIHLLEKRFLDEIDLIEKDSFKEPWSKDAYEKEINNPLSTICVITVNDEVVAYGGFWKILDEGDINNIAVKKEYRGKGFGKMLMNALTEEAKEQNIKAMTLEVRVSNKSAIELYKKFGFVEAGVRKKYYSDSEDALIMWLEEL